QLWQHFLGNLPGITQASLIDAQTAATDPAGITIRDLFERVYKDSVLRDHCILLPHFSDGDAHKHLNEEGHHERFAQIDCDGVYIEKPYSELEKTTKEKIYGQIDRWGKRRRAVVATGDNRTATWERLGFHECWIKLGEFTTEAIRQ